MTEETVRQRLEVLRAQLAELYRERSEVAANILRHEGAIVEFESLLKAEAPEPGREGE